MDITMLKLNGLRLISLINKGGVCKIYKAQKCDMLKELNETDFFAVKILQKKYCRSPSHVFSIENEYKITKKLFHESLIPVYDIIQYGLFFALTMKYVDAPTMATLMDKDELSIDQKIKCILSLANSLKYLHAQEIVHGDIKPSNILILPDFSINLLDFGVAEYINYPNSSFAYSYSRTYSSPEKMMGFRSNYRDDVYSFGCVANMLLWGMVRPISKVCTNYEMICFEKFKFYYELKLLLAQCMSQNPKSRPRDGVALYQRLTQIVD